MVGRFSFIVLGIPNFISFAIVAGLAALTLAVIPLARRRSLLGFIDVLSGFVSVFAALILAHCLGFSATFWLPMVSLAWLAVHFARLQRVGEFNRAAAGILLAWWLHQSVGG